MIPRENDHKSCAPAADVSELGFRKLAEFRHLVRSFLHCSEEAPGAEGIEPQQHQLLVTLKGLLKETRPTISTLAERLCLRHHSTVELVDRLVERGAVTRNSRESGSSGEVTVELTACGEALLHRLSHLHRNELRVSGPALSESLRMALENSLEDQGRRG